MNRLYSKLRCGIFLGLASFTVLSFSAAAQIFPGTILQALRFGNFAVINNNSAQSLTIHTNGTYTADPAFIMGSPPPQYGEILIETTAPNEACSIIFSDGTLSLNGAQIAPLFIITDQTLATPCMTNPDGSLDIRFGATLQTDASGLYYPSGSYSGEFEIILEF